MGWFKRKKEIDPSTEAAAFRIADRILRVQRKVADGLNVWAGRFNRKNNRSDAFGLGAGIRVLLPLAGDRYANQFINFLTI
jgi:hypothetical protein